MSGKVIHFEIPADNVERAQTFYREAFGWKIDPMPEMDYTIVSTTATNDEGMPTTAGAINGGMMRREGPITGPVITIDVPDLEQAMQHVSELGGKTIKGKETVADMGYVAYVADPEGNIIGLWQNA